MASNLVRTPAHFGTMSLKEAVLAEPGAFPNINPAQVNLFNQLHLVQGILRPDVDLTTRIKALSFERFNLGFEEFLSHLLHFTYPNVLRLSGLDTLATKVENVDFFYDHAAAVEVLKELHTVVNTKYETQLNLWASAQRAQAKADLELSVALRDNKNLKEAQRNADDASALFKHVREGMTPVRNLEAATRFVKLLLTEEASEKVTVVEVAQAIGQSVKWFPGLFYKEVAVADTYLN